MTPTTALLWKERREHRWFLIGGLLLFLGFPLLTATCAYFLSPHGGKFYSDAGPGMIFIFGPVLAILLAVGAVCRDLEDNVHAFWRSRPIPLVRLLAAKYITGLATFLLVIYATFILSVSMSLAALRKAHFYPAAPTFHHYVLALVLIYSVSFLIGCLVRNAARAAILSGLAALLIYLLPLVFPPLDSLGIFNLLLRSKAPQISSPTWFQQAVIAELPFIIATIAGSAGTVILSIAAVQRGWRLNVNKRLICWVSVAVLLILSAATLYPLASNLDCLQVLPVVPEAPARAGGVYSDLASVGDQGALIEWTRHDDLNCSPPLVLSAHSFSLSSPVPKIGPGVLIGTTDGPVYDRLNMTRIVWSPARPERAYVLLLNATYEEKKLLDYTSLELCTVAFDAGKDGAVIHRLDLRKHLPQVGRRPFVRICLYRDTIHLRAATVLFVVALENPDAPSLASTIELPPDAGFFKEKASDLPGRDPILTGLILLPLEGMSDRDRLSVSLALAPALAPSVFAIALEDDLVVSATRRSFSTYRVTGFDHDLARLDLQARMTRSPVAQMLLSPPRRIVLKDGLARVLSLPYNGDLTVYDVRDPDRPRPVGHYAAPGDYFFDLAPLPDGETLLAGKSLGVIASPSPDRLP